MEKIRLRDFRTSRSGILISFVLLALSLQTFAQGAAGEIPAQTPTPPAAFAATPSPSAPQELKVEVEVQIKEGDIAGAKEEAQKMAIQKAVEQSLPANTDEKTKAARLKNASQWVVGFSPIDSHEEAGVLKAAYRIKISDPNAKSMAEIPMPPGPASTAVASTENLGPAQTVIGPEKTFYRIIWQPSENQITPSEILAFLNTTMGVKATDVRLNRGNMIVAFSPKDSPQSSRQQIFQFLSGRGQVEITVDPNLVADREADAAAANPPPMQLQNTMPPPPEFLAPPSSAAPQQLQLQSIPPSPYQEPTPMAQ